MVFQNTSETSWFSAHLPSIIIFEMSQETQKGAGAPGSPGKALPAGIPPHAFFLVSAVFHYLGPAFAVLLFSSVSVLGVAWLRIAAAAAVFMVWRRPWRAFIGVSWGTRWTLIALGIVLGMMNSLFYLAIARVPLGTVGAIEFLGPIVLAALGLRTPRNIGALLLAVAGVWLLADVRISGEPLGFL